MTINASDIKLLESEIMADTADGGGRRTSRVIPDGVAGNIFPKVSRLDSVYGRVNLRKVYGAVHTANTDTYAGAHAVITDAPDNERIHTTLFSTASEFDSRAAARDRIESYVTSGPESRMTLLGRQLTGQQTVTVYQRIEAPLPEVGEVFCLSTEVGSTVTAQQYFRVQAIDSEIRTFTESISGAPVDFTRRVLTIGTGTPLRYDFTGPESATQFSNVAKPSKLRSTTFADAARYFGLRPLAEPASFGALSLKLDSVYTQIVPTTNRETPLANVPLATAGTLGPIKNGTRTENMGGWSTVWGVGHARRTLRGIQRGSLTLEVDGQRATDDLNGNVVIGVFVSATVDYDTGVIQRTGGTAGSWPTWSATYTPAAPITQIAHTREIRVSLANRGMVYVQTLNPLPAPGALRVDYRALGKWYRLTDAGDGTLAGDDPAYGMGTVDAASGVLALTLGALPDIDSSLIISYASPTHYAIRAGATADASATAQQRFTLSTLPIKPDSVTINYVANGVQYTAADDAYGAITGNGIAGAINYTTGEVLLKYTTRLPDPASPLTVDYQKLTPVTGGQLAVRSLVLPAAASLALGSPVAPGSLTAAIAFGGLSLTVRDNGNGLLIVPTQNYGSSGALNHGRVVDEQTIGTINYTTGDLVINQSVTVAGYVHGYNAWYWKTDAAVIAVGGGPANLGWRDSDVVTLDDPHTATVTFASAPLQLDTQRTLGGQIIPGSLLFTLGGKTYIDRAGTLYTDVSNVTGAGLTAGSVDYATGAVTVTLWGNNASPAVAVECALALFGEYTADAFALRTGGAPIRPGSFYIQATSEVGALLSASANNNGVIAGVGVTGRVDQETGVVAVRFGDMVTAAGNEAEPWYDPAQVVGGQIWRPTGIIPSTVRTNAVVVANLPLNADILGLDPVRLPSDGRVPIYRPADVVLIHHTGSTALPNPVIAGSTYNVGRSDLAEVWLTDQAGTRLTAGQYAYDLDAGTVTIAANFSAGALVQPLIARHRIEDMNLLTDVQISGDITLTAPLSRDFPLGSLVSSALVFGDLTARVTNLFDLQAFASWSDVPAAGATAQYNNIDYPLEVLNTGAVSERWRLNFTSTTAFQVIGENLGVIATGTTGADCAPANPLTLQPYFVIRAAGWGAGWSAGNQLRFNTVSASAPIWIARTVLPGATLAGDSFSLQMRGDVDA